MSWIDIHSNNYELILFLFFLFSRFSFLSNNQKKKKENESRSLFVLISLLLLIFLMTIISFLSHLIKTNIFGIQVVMFSSNICLSRRLKSDHLYSSSFNENSTSKIRLKIVAFFFSYLFDININSTSILRKSIVNFYFIQWNWNSYFLIENFYF